MLKNFLWGGKAQKVKFMETLQVTRGVACDVYVFTDDFAKDLGIIKIEPGHKTPLQKVLKGERTVEGYVSGSGRLEITRKNGKTEMYRVGGKSPKDFHINVEVGDFMRWFASPNATLVAYEICFPPYQDGRYENILDTTKLVVGTYNKIAKRYSDEYFEDLSDASYIDKFLSYLPNRAKVLDIGCGPGTFTLYMLDKGYEAQGIDVSKKMLRIAQRKIPKAVFTLMDMRRLKFSDKSFDGLLVAYSLIHIPTHEISKTLQEFSRVLKPTGAILIIAQKGKADQIIDEPFKKGEKMFFNFFTKKRLSQLLTNAGFRILYQHQAKTLDTRTMSDAIIYTIAQKG